MKIHKLFNFFRKPSKSTSNDSPFIKKLQQQTEPTMRFLSLAKKESVQFKLKQDNQKELQELQKRFEKLNNPSGASLEVRLARLNDRILNL